MNVIGVDLGGTRIKIGIIADGELRAHVITDITSERRLSDYLPLIKEHIGYLQMESQIYDIQGIGIAFPGLVNTEDNHVIDTSGKYEDATSIDLVGWAKRELGLELKLENDARLACLGEWKYGAGKNSHNMVMCTLGTGVGTSAIIDGKILRGKHFQAGILGGHSIIDFNNTEDRCSCGNYGCVEAAASSWMIEESALKHAKFGESRLSKSEKIDLAAVFEHSFLGDELSLHLREQCMKAWATCLINLIHAYDPEVVVVGGGIMHSKEILLPYFKKEIQDKVWCPSGIPDLRSADYPDTAALLGAVLLFE